MRHVNDRARKNANEEEPTAPFSARRWRLVHPLRGAEDPHDECVAHLDGAGDHDREARRVQRVVDSHANGCDEPTCNSGGHPPPLPAMV